MRLGIFFDFIFLPCLPASHTLNAFSLPLPPSPSSRYTLMNKDSGDVVVKFLTAEQCKDRSHFVDKATGTELEVQESEAMLEWLANNYKKFGCVLEFVTNKSQEGSQFCRGFGGIGGLLRYQVRRQTGRMDHAKFWFHAYLRLIFTTWCPSPRPQVNLTEFEAHHEEGGDSSDSSSDSSAWDSDADFI